MFTTPTGPALEQGDIFDGCPLPVLPDELPTGGPDEIMIPEARVVVLTQTCDLAQAKTDRVVVAVVHSAARAIELGILKAATVRDQIRFGKVYGWYFLPAAGDFGLPESVIDFRDLHTIPRSVIEHLITADRRVCRLATPYREHLAQHFAVTYMRIALPEPYETRP